MTHPFPTRRSSYLARIAMLRYLATAACSRCMFGGQALDIDATGAVSPLRVEDLERLHALKTGALLRAAVRLGAIAAGVDANTREHLDRFADALGLAFQVRDDLLDVGGDSPIRGKTPGKDAEHEKATFPALIGVQASHEAPRTLRQALDRKSGV